MPVVAKIVSLFEALTQADLEAMSPFERRRFADQCKHWAKIADAPRAGVTLPKVGVLSALHKGDRAH